MLAASLLAAMLAAVSLSAQRHDNKHAAAETTSRFFLTTRLFAPDDVTLGTTSRDCGAEAQSDFPQCP